MILDAVNEGLLGGAGVAAGLMAAPYLMKKFGSGPANKAIDAGRKGLHIKGSPIGGEARGAAIEKAAGAKPGSLSGKSKGGQVKKENVHVDMVAHMLDEMTPGGRAREAVNYQRGGYHGDADFMKKNMDAIDTNLKKLSPFGIGGFPKARAQAKPKAEPKSKPTIQNAGYEPEGDMLSEKRVAVTHVLSQLSE